MPALVNPRSSARDAQLGPRSRCCWDHLSIVRRGFAGEPMGLGLSKASAAAGSARPCRSPNAIGQADRARRAGCCPQPEAATWCNWASTATAGACPARPPYAAPRAVTRALARVRRSAWSGVRRGMSRRVRVAPRPGQRPGASALRRAAAQPGPRQRAAGRRPDRPPPPDRHRSSFRHPRDQPGTAATSAAFSTWWTGGFPDRDRREVMTHRDAVRALPSRHSR